MNYKYVFTWSLAIIGFVYIFYKLLLLSTTIPGPDSATAWEAFKSYNIAIWVGWVLITTAAVIFKWRNNREILFILDYIIILLSFSFLGYYLEEGVSNFSWNLQTGMLTLPSGFAIALKNILIMGGMTVFIRVCIWWFSLRWHRR